MNDHFFVPILNGYRFFYTDLAIGQLSRQEYNEVDYEGLTIAQYCQKARRLTSDLTPVSVQRRVQFQTNFEFIEIDIFDRDLSSIDTIVPTEVLDVTSTVGYKIYEFDVDWDSYGDGYYKIQINVNDGVTPVEPVGPGLELLAVSEWISVRENIEAWDNCNVIKLTNDINDYELYWEGGDAYEVEMVVESLFFRRAPATTRTFFRTSRGLPRVLSAKFQRRNQMDIYNIPPYLHEQLAIAFMCTNVEIDEENYVSEEGLGEPAYKGQHYLLSNNTAILESKIGLTNGLEFEFLTFYIVDNEGNLLVDNSGNNIVWQ